MDNYSSVGPALEHDGRCGKPRRTEQRGKGVRARPHEGSGDEAERLAMKFDWRFLEIDYFSLLPACPRLLFSQ
jgi:hypothetical protein